MDLGAAAPYPPPQGYPPPGYAQPAYAPPLQGPEQITEFDENAPVPYGYTKVSKTRKGLVIGGSITFGVTYLISAMTAAIGEDLRRTDVTKTDTSALWFPIVGPFLQLGKTTSSEGKFVLVQLGIAQTLGAIMLVYGITTPRVMLIRNDRLSMTVTPLVTADASGLSLVGTF